MKSKLSKVLVLLLSLAMMAAQLVVPTFAVESQLLCECDSATRTGTLKETIPATCAQNGYELYKCNDCGKNYFIALPATGAHNYVDTDAKDPTCTEIGWDAYHTCSVCGDTNYQEKPALGHDYDDGVITPPTCTEQGYTTHTCSRCDATKVDTYVDALGHTPKSPVEEGRVDADCENDGHYDSVVYCEVCNAEISRETVTLPAIGHNYQEIDRQEATCVDDGYIDYECANCGDTKRETIACRGYHDYVIIGIDAATCDKAKNVTYECKDCGYTITEPVNGPLGHTVVVDEAVEPTCTETGLTEGSHCSVCQAVIVAQNIVPALGHDYVAVVTAPTCTTDGYTTHTCSRCNDSYTDSVVPSDINMHKLVSSKPAVAATCTTTGLSHEVSCEICGKVVVEQTVTAIDPNNHDYVAVVTAPTCTEQGYTTHTCSRCSDTYVDAYVDALEHDLVHHDAQAPTCTEIGWDAYDTCSRCDYTTYVEKSALGHNYTSVVTAPTCTTDGYTTHTCSRCNDTYVDTIVPALGHSTSTTIGHVDATCIEGEYYVKKCTVCQGVWRDYVTDPLGHEYDAVVTDPTCTTDGYTTHTCSRCNDTYVDSKVDALGHDYNDVVTDPTCTTGGYTTHTCSRCNDTYVDSEVDALGHDHQAVVTAPTCTTGGYTTHTCSRCDDSFVDTYVDALGHTEVIDEAVAPTYDETGLTEGKHCSVCDEVLVAQQEVERVKENVNITYEISGINGTDVAVNSGKVTLNVYMETEFARLYAFNCEFTFDGILELVEVKNGDAFALLDYNLTNATTVKLMPHMGMTFAGKEFAAGKYLVATLTFKVNKDFTGVAQVTASDYTVTRDTEVLLNQVVVNDTDKGAQIDVVKLGNSNPDVDNEIDAQDVLAYAKWVSGASEGEYNAIYDLNKDGKINGQDFALLRGAAVGNEDYLN